MTKIDTEADHHIFCLPMIYSPSPWSRPPWPPRPAQSVPSSPGQCRQDNRRRPCSGGLDHHFPLYSSALLSSLFSPFCLRQFLEFLLLLLKFWNHYYFKIMWVLENLIIFANHKFPGFKKPINWRNMMSSQPFESIKFWSLTKTFHLKNQIVTGIDKIMFNTWLKLF